MSGEENSGQGMAWVCGVELLLHSAPRGRAGEQKAGHAENNSRGWAWWDEDTRVCWINMSSIFRSRQESVFETQISELVDVLRPK